MAREKKKWKRENEKMNWAKHSKNKKNLDKREQVRKEIGKKTLRKKKT